jgi:hypothetical protein
MDSIIITAIALPYSENVQNDFAVVIYNVTIPAIVINDYIQSQQVLTRVQALIIEDFGQDHHVSYQITASYYLKHSATQRERLWTGSFFARDYNPAVISGFNRFNANQFANEVLIATRNVEEKLQWRGLDTKWQFNGLHTIVISFQCRLETNQPLLGRRGLRVGRNRKTTFALP